MPQTKTQSKKPATKEAAPNLLNVAFVWDMSGSMGSIVDATKEGTQGYLLDLQKEEKKLVRRHGAGVYTKLSLTAFDTVFEPWIVNEPVAEIDVKKIIANYQPRGATALYDAIANTIVNLETSASKEEKFLVIVMTDGQENSSQEYSLHQDGRKRLFDLIEAYQKKGNWTFVYLGANVDAYAEAQAIGIPTGNAAFYAMSRGSVAASSGGTSNVTSTLRSSSQGQTMTAFADAGETQDYRDVDFKKDETGK